MNTERGLVKLIILIAIAIFIVSLFGISLRDVSQEGTVQDNFSYTKQVLETLWNDYLKKPFIWIWDTLFFPFIIEPINNWVNTENTAP
ncbi:hypothetical protein CL654_02565 [bacterium]|nr:hypothetical protein [bacterium]|tara:strand:+ start:10168 stop:10431 length:264 start_codon:yes stop_codon:yes gene_type:complete